MSAPTITSRHRPLREVPDKEWLALWQEPVIEPELPIVDPHHHLIDFPRWRYLFDDFSADIATGHNIRATVFLQWYLGYRTDGPKALRPVGETEFASGVASMSESRPYGNPRVCTGIVGYADFTLGTAVEAVLEAHLEAGRKHFRGIRHVGAHDPCEVFASRMLAPPGLYLDARFRQGFACLSRYDLSFDAWLFHPQIQELTSLARAFPQIPIVLDHVGGPLGLGAYADRRQEIFEVWHASIRKLADCPNVWIKLGGLGMRLPGFDFSEQPIPPSSADLAAAWRPYIETCIEVFGTKRAMFESNFPVDKISCSYPVLWNAFKRIAASYSAEEKADLFAGSAARFYRLNVDT